MPPAVDECEHKILAARFLLPIQMIGQSIEL